ncbi:MAG TPA: YbaK/EbsC family protein [Bauldia sp.]|nr:YbaK/EbsC family protein [Bauldia sp.]
MVNVLPPAAERVQKAAEALGLDVTVMIMPASTHTAEQAAAACGTSVAQIVKSLIFQGKTSKKPYLFLVSGVNRVNEKAVAATIGEAIVRPDATFVRDETGFAIGGIPPLGHDRRLVPYIDADLLQYGTVWAAAGTPNAVFEVSPQKLKEATGAVVISVK